MPLTHSSYDLGSIRGITAVRDFQRCTIREPLVVVEMRLLYHAMGVFWIGTVAKHCLRIAAKNVTP
jgi:hypothetical protein